MKDKNNFYITTPLYYPSANLTIGHTYTTVAVDALARYKRLQGYDVKFLTGTDEHGQKIEKAAEERGVSPKDYVDKIVGEIKELWETMDISYDIFIRTTDDYHEKTVQKIFQILYDKGDIYKGVYEGYYCTPCESFFTEKQLNEGKCPDCNRDVEKQKEETYFFKLSKYTDKLIKHIEENPDFIQPESRRNEMLNNFLKPGLDDLSVTRSSFDWGIKVPFDEDHVIYVWTDALSNYITALGYLSDDDSNYKKYWPADIHFVGKEIVRFHTIIWPALLLALGEELPKQVFGHGWILFDDDKMSKSKGNVIYPESIIDLYGVDALKYFLLREFTFGQDGSFTKEKFMNRLNSDLANDLGNLVSRTVAMIDKYNGGIIPESKEEGEFDDNLKGLAISTFSMVDRHMDELKYSNALEEVWKLISRTNKYIDETTPWILAKDDEKKDRLDTVLYNLAESIRIISVLIRPFMENTSNEIWKQLGIDKGLATTWESLSDFGRLESGLKVRKEGPMFPRLEVEKEIKKLDEANKKLIEERTGKKGEEVNDVEQDYISIDEFDKVDLKIAEILKAEKHPDADKLLVFKLKVGEEIRQIVSGIAEVYSPEELIGKKVVIVANLKPIKLRGVKSEGMILSAEKGKALSLLTTLDEIESGAKVL